MSYNTWPARLVALAVVCAFGMASRLPEHSSSDVAQAAARFKFEKLPLAKTGAALDADVHPVNPIASQIARWLSSIGTAISIGDIDKDGVSNDICQVEPRSGEIIVSTVPRTGERFSTFILKSSMAPDPDTQVATGCKVGDFNEDGLPDLLIHYVGRTPILFMRKTMVEGQDARPSLDSFHATPLTVTEEPWWTSTVLQVDVDADGHLDLVVANYFPDGQVIFGKDATGPVTMHDTFARARNGGKNRIFLWKRATVGQEPGVVFEEAPNPFPDDDATAWTLALGSADLDKDGRSELYFANDFGPDVLYANRSTPGKVRLVRLHGKKGFFTPTSRVLGNDSFKGMGVDFGDLNGDGLFDIFVSNITVHGGLEESHFVFLSNNELAGMDAGVAPYKDEGEALGVSRSSWGWDTRMVDFDNDGGLELMQATGFLKGALNWWADLAEFANGNDKLVSDPRNWPAFPENIDISGHDPEPFYTMGKDGRFMDLSKPVGFDGQWNARGLAVGDVNRDGDLDLALANQWEDSWFFENRLPAPKSYLALSVMLSPSVTSPMTEGLMAQSWPAIGALVTVTLPDGKVLIRQVDGGNGHSGASAPEIHFGLGDSPSATSLSVNIQWRDHLGVLHNTPFTLAPGWHNLTLPSQGTR